MPKYKIICFILAAVLASVGTVAVLRNLGGGFVPPDNENAETDLNVYLDRTEDMDISDPNADVRTFLFVAHKLLLQRMSFKGVSSGTSTAMGGIEQSVLNTRVVLGEFGNKRVFKEMVTKGIVSNAYQLYLDGLGETGNYIYRGFDRVKELTDVEWSSVAQPLSRQAFYNKFGHRSDKLTSYVLNWDTVLEGELAEQKDGLYTFRYVLDTETAPQNLRYEMVTNGGLSGFPTFTKCEIYVTMDADFQVKSLRTDCAYQAMTMGINAGCAEDITETFEEYQGDLPYSDFFTPYLGQQGGTLEEKATPLEMLMQLFNPYLNGTDLNVGLAVTEGGEQRSEALLSISGLDISDLSKLSVSAQLGKMNIAYDNQNGKLLLNYQDFNGSTTVDGLMQLAGTFSALLGTDAPQAASESEDPSGFDAGAILDKLSYTISDDQSTCTVSLQLTSADLPVDLGDLSVDAQLVGYLEGKNYNFAYADITLGNVGIHVEPRDWTPVAIDGNAPEILGLADLISNGKLSLNADVRLPLFGTDYDVKADLLADLGNLSVKASATLNDNGKLDICYADNTAYVTFGQLRFRMNVKEANGLAQLFEDILGEQMPSVGLSETSDVRPGQLLAMFGGFDAVNTGSGKVALVLTLGELKLSLNLVASDNRWTVETITAVGYGVNATIAPQHDYEDITAPADADSYADVTELAQTFARPIADLVRGDSYGIEIKRARVTFDGKQYDVSGNFALDANGNIKLDATLYDGDVGVVDATVTVAGGKVYLTVNGVSVAFAANGMDEGSDPTAALQQLADNEQIKRLLDEHEEIKQLADAVFGAVQTLKDVDLQDLLTVDFTQFVTQFSFEGGTLSMTLDGDPVGLDIAFGLELSVEEDGLCVEANGRIANLQLDVSAKAHGGESVEIPDEKDYLLTLHGEILGAQADITADLVNMDIWASVHFRNETVLLRYRAGKVYVVYGGAKLVFDTTDLDGLMEKINTLAGEQQLPDMQQADVLALFAAFGNHLTGEQHNLTFDHNDVHAAVNFANDNGKLVFDNVTLRFALNGKQYQTTLTTQRESAAKLDTNDAFADGNAIANKVLDTVSALADAEHFAYDGKLQVEVDGNVYDADLQLNFNGGVYASLVLRDGTGKVLVSAQVTYIDNTLYLDVNGIRQATELAASGATTNDSDFAKVLGVLNELRGENDVLDSVIDAVEQLPRDLDGITFSQIIDDLYLSGDALVVKLALEQFRLDDVTVTVGFGSQPTLSINKLALGKVAVGGTVTVNQTEQTVDKPDETKYSTGLRIDLGNGMSALLRLDLADKTVVGELKLSAKESVLFRYEDGVVYLQSGELFAKVALKDASELLDVLGNLVKLPTIPQTGDVDVTETIKKALGMLTYARTSTEDGYAIRLNVSGMDVTLHFACTDSTATLVDVAIDTGVDALPHVLITLDDDVSVDDIQTDKNEFMDVTQVVEKFAEPISNLLKAKGYSATFNTDVKLDGTAYNVSGTLAIDADKAVKVNATVKQGDVGIINVEATIVNGGVYVTFNGIKFAFKLSDGNAADADFASAMDQLLANEQVKTLLDEHQALQKLLDKLGRVAQAFASTDIENIDFGTLLQKATFQNNVLHVDLNASAFELGNFSVELGNDDGKLAVKLVGLDLDGVVVDNLDATVFGNSDAISTPDHKQYVLNLHFVGFGAVADVSADLYDMDIAANVTYNNDLGGIKIAETAQLRYVGKTLYVKLGNIALKFDTGNAMTLVTRIMDMLGVGSVQMPDMDVNDVLGKLAIDLAGSHTVTYTDGDLALTVNFAQNDDDMLVFDGITATLGEQKLTFNTQTASAQWLPTDGGFVNGNTLVGKICDVIDAIDLKALVKEESGIHTQFDVGLTLRGNAYKANIVLTYKEGVSVDITLKDATDKLMVKGNIIVKDHKLYLDINGIKQAVKLNDTQKDDPSEQFEFDDLETALQSYRGINDVLDAVIDFVQGLPAAVHNLTTVSDLVNSLTLDKQKTVLLGIAATKLGLEKDITLTLGMKEGNVTFAISDIALGKGDLLVANVSEGTAIAHGTAVRAPSEEETAKYVAEFKLGVTIDKQTAQPTVCALDDVAASPDITVTVRLDLYHDRVYGYADIGSTQVKFELDTSNEPGVTSRYVYAQVGGGTKLKFDVNNELDEVVAAVKDLLATLGNVDVTLPKLSVGGSTADIVKSILDGFTYTSTDSGYRLGINFNGIGVSAGFKADKNSVSLGELTVNGEGFDVSLNQNATLDGTNSGIDHENTAEFGNAKDVINNLVTAVKTLAQAEGYRFYLDGTLELDGTTYTLTADVAMVGSDLYVQAQLGNVFKGQVWIADGFVYVKANGINLKLKLPEAAAESQSRSFTTKDVDNVLNALEDYEYFGNDRIKEVVELVRKLLDTQFGELDLVNMLGVKVQNDAIALSVDGSIWGVSKFAATVSPNVYEGNIDGIKLTLSDFGFGKIALSLAEASVTATDSIAALPTEDSWTTDFDVEFDDHTDVDNVIHVSLDLVNNVVYAKIESQNKSSVSDNEVYELYVKYDIANNKLWLSNHKKVNASVDINDIGSIVNEVQNIVNKVAKEEHNFELPNLFQGGMNIGDVLDTLRIGRDGASGGLSVHFDAMGFGIDAVLGKNALSADIDVRSLLENTDLHVKEGVTDAHTDFVKEINRRVEGTDVKYVPVDEVFDYLFYGDNGTLDEDKTNNGVMYDLIETNAWRFDFNSDDTKDTTTQIDVTSTNEQGEPVTDSYRIKKGSYIAFAFNKSDTSFSMNTLISEFGNEDKTNAYQHLFDLLNSLQLRAKLTLLKKANGENDYNEMIILDVALLRTQETVYEDGETIVRPKSRLYVSYDSSSSRDGVLRATLNLDSLQDVIGLKDALDSVLNNAISKLIGTITDAIAKAQNNMPKLQLGRLARLFNEVTFDDDSKNFVLELNGKALSDELGIIKLDVSPYDGDTAAGANRRGRGLRVNQLQFSYGGVSINLADMIVSASTYSETEGDGTAQNRTYDYVTYAINGYLNDNKASNNASGALSTPESFNKSNVAPFGSTTGYDMSNHIDLDSIYELLASLAITAGNYDENRQRSFYIAGDLHATITFPLFNWEMKDVKIPIKFYADIDSEGHSYFAVKIERGDEKVLGTRVFADHGGNSYLTYSTRTNKFNVVRDSISKVNKMVCTKCGKEITPNGLNEFSCDTQDTWWDIRTRHGKDYLEVLDADLDSSDGGTPSFIAKNAKKEVGVSPAEFMENLMGGPLCERGYLFEMINFGEIPLVDIEGEIKKAVNNKLNEFGIEDVLNSGNSYYYDTSTSDKQFKIIANLKAMSDGLGTLYINIHHSGDFNSLIDPKTGLYKYDADKIKEIKLNRLEGKLENMASGFVQISFDLTHVTPKYGTAFYFTEDGQYSRLWDKDSAAQWKFGEDTGNLR